jgi:ribosomal protein S3AE
MAERKKFVDVRIPILDSSTRVLGTAEDLDGKTIKLDLTRKLRGKGLTITFKIFNNEGKLVAIPKKMELVKSYIRRMMRKRVDYVEESFTANCKDIKATLKPLLITRKRVSRAVRKNLRNTCREFLVEYAKERTYLEICNELLDGTIQREMLPRLKKVYPLSFYDLRIFESKELDKIDLKEASFEKKVEEPVEEQVQENIEKEKVVEEVEEKPEEKPVKVKKTTKKEKSDEEKDND